MTIITHPTHTNAFADETRRVGDVVEIRTKCACGWQSKWSDSWAEVCEEARAHVEIEDNK